MLSINDYNHIKLLYEQLFKLNKCVNDYILNKDWDSVNFALKDKSNLISKIVQFEKPRLSDIKENKILNDIRTELYELEKKNLELVKKIKEDSLAELKNVKKARKVLNAYEPITAQIKSTVDISDVD